MTRQGVKGDGTALCSGYLRRQPEIGITSNPYSIGRNRPTPRYVYPFMPAAMNIQPLSAAQIGGIAMHTFREHSATPAHIDPERSRLNQQLLGDRNALDNLPTHQPNGRKIRSDARHAAGLVCTLPKELDPNDPDHVQQWTQATVQWLQKGCPGTVAWAVLHMDETRPHIHAAIIPENENKHLSYKAHFGSPAKLRSLYKSYSDRLEPLGVIPHTEAEKAVLKRGYTKGIDGWRVGRAVLDAQEQVREKTQELKALTPDPTPVTIRRSRLFSPSAEWWRELERKWMELKGQMLAWRGKANLLEGRLAERDHTIHRLSGHVHKLARRLLDRTPDKERLPLARELRSLGIKARAFDRIIAKDNARQWERSKERDQDRGLGL